MAGFVIEARPIVPVPVLAALPAETGDVPIEGTMTGVLSGKRWSGALRLEPLGVDLLERGG